MLWSQFLWGDPMCTWFLQNPQTFIPTFIALMWISMDEGPCSYLQLPLLEWLVTADTFQALFYFLHSQGQYTILRSTSKLPAYNWIALTKSYDVYAGLTQRKQGHPLLQLFPDIATHLFKFQGLSESLYTLFPK